MAYFNHAFSKSWLATDVAADGVATGALGAGDLALVDSRTWLSDSASDIATAKHLAYLVGGNFHNADNIGNNPGHGGYKESIKSKGINFNYVSRLGVSACTTLKQATACVTVGSTCAPCGENLFLRMDVKGSPALRFLNHNAYAIGDSSGDAAANGGPLPGLCCADGQEYLDPVLALAAAMQMTIADPIVKPFVAEGNNVTGFGTIFGGTATYANTNDVAVTGGTGSGLTVDITTSGGVVTAVALGNEIGSGYTEGDVVTITGGDGTATVVVKVSAEGIVAIVNGVETSYTLAEALDGTYTPVSIDPVAEKVSARACVVGAYIDTKFGDCSFDTRDFYGKEPVSIILSLLDETGNPCNDCGVATATPGQMANTSGETVLRALLLTERYAQNPFNQGNRDSSRIREIEGFDPILAAVDRTKLYKVYYLQHSVPRLNNPSGVFDNDQYLYQIFVKCDDTATATKMDTLWAAIAAECATVGNYTVEVETGL
tara:strand:+ start:3455 stop:4918 length:1464 start_codon:yes stop_codon:yes gene_type:complete